MTKKKKPNKRQREQKRAEQAALYNEAFNHGYVMAWDAREKEVQELQRQIELMDRNRRKIHGALGGYK